MLTVVRLWVWNWAAPECALAGLPPELRPVCEDKTFFGSSNHPERASVVSGPVFVPSSN